MCQGGECGPGRRARGHGKHGSEGRKIFRGDGRFQPQGSLRSIAQGGPHRASRKVGTKPEIRNPKSENYSKLKQLFALLFEVRVWRLEFGVGNGGLAWDRTRTSGVRDRRAASYTTRPFEVVESWW